MKNFYVCFVLLFTFLFFNACQDKKQASKESTTTVDSTLNRISINDFSIIFKEILKSDAGMARGVSIGDKIETLQETILPSETQPTNGKSFTVYFDGSDLNFADILYQKDSENKVSAISIDIFIENKAEVDSLMKEFVSYFDKKYGKGKGISKMMTWQMPDGNNLMVQDVSTEKDRGLKVVFADKNGFNDEKFQIKLDPASLLKNQKEHPERYLNIETKSIRTDGFGTVAILNCKIKNNSDFDFKDIIIKVTYFGESGTEINDKEDTILKIVKAHSMLNVKEFNLGYVNQQFAKYKVRILSATVVE